MDDNEKGKRAHITRGEQSGGAQARTAIRDEEVTVSSVKRYRDMVRWQ